VKEVLLPFDAQGKKKNKKKKKTPKRGKMSLHLDLSRGEGLSSSTHHAPKGLNNALSPGFFEQKQEKKKTMSVQKNRKGGRMRDDAPTPTFMISLIRS